VGRKKHKKALSHSGDTTSKQEKMLAKPLKSSKKLSMQRSGVQSSGLSVGEKASSVKAPHLPPTSVGNDDRKKPIVSTIGARAVNLLVSATSDEDANPLKPRRKRALKSPSPEVSLKSLGAANIGGTLLCLTCFSFG
jgi:hypothetical protein